MSFFALPSPWRQTAAVAAVFFAILATGRALPERNFETSRTLAAEVSTTVELLEQVHFNHEAVNSLPKPELGQNLIHDYMADLDGQRLFFLATDQEAFTRRYANALYYNLRTLGRLDAAFDIYVQYEKRVDRRINWIFEELKKDYDFTTHETYSLERSQAAWPATQTEADDLWRRRLKFELLQDLLDKKTIAEARQNVHRRYERMLKNLADIETNDVAEIFLTSLANQYDPHSTYFSPETYEDFNIQMRLSLVGIGALLGIEDDQCVVKELIPGGPADLGRQLQPNDKIIAVATGDAEPIDIIGMKLRKVVDLIRGPKGSKVRLTVIPAGVTDGSARKEITLVRDVVKLNSARARAAIYEVPGAAGATTPIGVITLPSFYGLSGEDDHDGVTSEERTSATKDVAELINRLDAAGIKALVLDLRRNGGGLLSEAIDLTGLFINRGPVVQVKSFSGDVQVDSDEDTRIRYTGPLAVLVSRFSASASEIVAGALQNYGRAAIIGDQSTHGKGSVQTLVEMKNVNRMLSRLPVKTGAVKLTIQKFYLPNGSSTQNKGVTPDIVLPSVDEYMPIGESDLPHALVWDEIPSTTFSGQPLAQQILTPLRDASRSRQQHLEEFAYLRKGIDWFKAKQDQKEISLNLDERHRQREADDVFKKAMDAEKDRLAQGDFSYHEFTLVPPTPKPGAAEKKTDAGDGEDTLSTEEDPGITKLDIPLRESLRVLADALALSRNHPSWADGNAPLTAQVSKNG
ncbi:MAG: carboxy terminal-processing peptidase [Opitutaceae bacterium]|nr:carboxy terminal-processing peptidase [Opitutaceae bacterium]